MLKSLIASILIILTLSLFGCSLGVSGLQSYVDITDGYEFLYPNGWIAVDVKNASQGVDVVYRDLIDRTENLSVIISDVDKEQDLENLGSPTEVGYRFMQMVNNNPNSNREAELIDAQLHQNKAKNYYILEYSVKLPNNESRHNVASVIVNKGKLFTFNISTPESRWQAVKKLFTLAAKSFSVT
jgi:photosystem II oxygen-evolving enhancer protein 2